MKIPVVDVMIKTRPEDDIMACVFSTVILKYGIPLSEQITQRNTKYVVRWKFDLGRTTLTVPEGCILDFDGGAISNGTIAWNKTKVCNPYKYDILENVQEEGERINI